MILLLDYTPNDSSPVTKPSTAVDVGAVKAIQMSFGFDWVSVSFLVDSVWVVAMEGQGRDKRWHTVDAGKLLSGLKRLHHHRPDYDVIHWTEIEEALGEIEDGRWDVNVFDPYRYPAS